MKLLAPGIVLVEMSDSNDSLARWLEENADAYAYNLHWLKDVGAGDIILLGHTAHVYRLDGSELTQDTKLSVPFKPASRELVGKIINDIDYMHLLLERRWTYPKSAVETTVLNKLTEIEDELRELIQDDVRRVPD